jgi:hypothetical protein
MNIHEQLAGVAKSVSIWLVLFGGIGGVLISLRNIIAIYQAVAEGQAGLDLIWPFLALIIGLGLAGYFGYIALLKARLKKGR